jgi:hypothetical protein
MEITKNALENLMIVYVDHKKMMREYENDDETECTEYAFHQGCCETAETWMRAVGVSPNCNFITDRLYK